MPPYLVPGDTFKVTILDIGNFPVTDCFVTLDFSAGPWFNPCSTSPCTGCVLDSLDHALGTWTDLLGQATFPINSGDYFGPSFGVRVSADYVSIGTTTCQPVAAKRALVISGSQDSWMKATQAQAAANYEMAGWQVTHFQSWEHAKADSALAAAMRAGSWNAICLVAHGECPNSSSRGAFELEELGGGTAVPYTDDLAEWFRNSTQTVPDEVILHSCELGKESGLAEKFRTPNRFVTWDYEAMQLEFFFWEYFHQSPPGAPGEPSIAGVPDTRSYVRLPLAPAGGMCIGENCGDGTCMDFASDAQVVVDSALSAMVSAASYVDTDSLQVRNMLAGAAGCFTRAWGLETDPYKKWVLASHARDIDLMLGMPVLVPVVPHVGVELKAGVFHYPNPSRSVVVIRYVVPVRGPASVAVFDAKGRPVAELANSVQAAGEHVLTWNGRWGSGEPTSAGVYFIQLRSAGGGAVSKVVLLQ